MLYNVVFIYTMQQCESAVKYTYYLAALVARLVKNLPAMQETLVPLLDPNGSLEEGMATHSNILTWRITMDRGVW